MTARTARAALTYLADPVLGALLDACEPDQVLAAIRTGALPSITCGITRSTLNRALDRWRLRLPDLPPEQTLDGDEAYRDGIRLICPGDPRWPTRLDELGQARPYALWVRGSGDLIYGCARSVSMVG